MASRSATTIIALVAATIALALGSRLFVPVALGLTLAAILYPLVGGLRRLRVPTGAGAALAVLLAIVVLVVAVVLLQGPVRDIAAEIPKTLIGARRRLESLGVQLPGHLGPATQPQAQQNTPAEAPPSGIMQTVTRVFGVTAGVLFALIEILLLAFFILAAGDRWREKLRDATASDTRYQRALGTVLEIRHVVLRYLVMNVLINAAQAIVVGLVVWALGYPTPLLWAILTFIAEFIPYFGGAAMVALLLLQGLAQARGLGHAILAPAAYLLITTLQNNLVSPAAYGQGLRLNPTAILVGVIFWGVVWGIAGVFLAVPLLAATRIIAEQTETWKPVAVFLAD